MAALQSIRKHGILILIVVGIALILFIVPNDFWQYITHRDATTIAEIDGNKVAYEEYQNALYYHENYLKIATGKTSFTEQESENLRYYAWNEIMQKHLYEKNLAKAGLALSEDEMEDLLYGSNIHDVVAQQQMFINPNTGYLDTASVKRFFSQADVNDTIAYIANYWKKTIKTDRLNTKYRSMVSKAFYTPSAIAKMEYEDVNTKYNIEILAKDYRSMPDDSVNVSDEEIKKYYDENLYKFTSDKAARKFDYVSFDVVPSAEDTLNAKNEIEKYYEEFAQIEDAALEYAVGKSEIPVDTNFIAKEKMPLGLNEEFFDAEVGSVSEIILFNDNFFFSKITNAENRPDSVQISAIILSTNDSTSIEQCREQADSIKLLATSGNQDFTILAFMNSVDEETKQKGGDLGWFQDGNSPLLNNLQLNEDVFTANKGDIFIKDIFFGNGMQGVGIFKVNNNTEKSRKVKLATVNKQINYSDDTYQYFFSLANDFMSKSTSAEKFDSIVAKNSLIKKSANVSELDNKFSNLSNVREIVKWAFSAENIGEVSDVFPHESSFLIAKVTSITEKGYKSVEEVTPLIQKEIVKNKKAEIFMEEMKNDLAKTSNLLELSEKQYRYDTIKNINFTQPYLQNYGQEQKVAGAMTAMPENKLSEIIKGDNAVYVFKVIEKTAANEKDNYDAEKLQSIQSALRQAYRISSTLEQMGNIKDYRAKFN